MSNRNSVAQHSVAAAIREALDYKGMSQADLSAVWGVAQPLISQLVNGHRSVTPLVALRLEAAGFGSATAWLDLQRDSILAEYREIMADELAEIAARCQMLGI